MPKDPGVLWRKSRCFLKSPQGLGASACCERGFAKFAPSAELIWLSVQGKLQISQRG
jgi:hypothetical protein